MGTARAGMVARVWADCDLIHVLIAEVRIKTVRSHLSATDLAVLDEVKRQRGVRPAVPPPRPSAEPIRVHRRAANAGVVMVAGQKITLGRLHRHKTITVTVSTPPW
jgi:hypothetical protein